MKILVRTNNFKNSPLWDIYHFYDELSKQVDVIFVGKGYEIENVEDITDSFDWCINCKYPNAKSVRIRTDNHRDSKHNTPHGIVKTLNKDKWDLVLNRCLNFTYPGIEPSFYLDNLNMPCKSLMWSLDEDIFSYNEENKKNDIVFAGASSSSYPIRAQISKEIHKFSKTNNYKLFTGKRPGHVKKDLNYLLKYKDNKKTVKVGIEYVKLLQNSKLMLTCGSKYNIPVRKYFESIATGCLLLADKTHNWDEVGLVDGESFVEINENNWKEKTKYYLENDKERIRIIRNARKVFEERHTNKIRVNQLISILKENM